MENQNNLALNDQAIVALRESSKWCLFLSILGFIGIGFMILFGLFMSAAMSAVGENTIYGSDPMNPFGAIKAYIGVMYIIIAALYFFPIYYLYHYATGMKRALESGDSNVLSNALVNLKSHHKFLGITAIVVISLYIIIIIAALLFAAKMATSGI